MMKKCILPILLILGVLLAGCSSDSTNAGGKQTKVKVGIRNSELRTWEFLKEQAEKEGVEIEIVNFSSAYDRTERWQKGILISTPFNMLPI